MQEAGYAAVASPPGDVQMEAIPEYNDCPPPIESWNEKNWRTLQSQDRKPVWFNLAGQSHKATDGAWRRLKKSQAGSAVDLNLGL